MVQVTKQSQKDLRLSILIKIHGVDMFHGYKNYRQINFLFKGEIIKEKRKVMKCWKREKKRTGGGNKKMRASRDF